MSEVYFIIDMAIMIAAVSAFVILLIGKIGLRNWLIAITPKLISQLFDCDFCLSFWLSVILASILAIIWNEPLLLIIPIVSTPITRILL